MRNKLSIRTIVAIGIGAAVFMILGRFGSIPTGIPNTSIETSYALLALMSVIYGPIAGFEKKQIIIFNIYQIIANALAWILVAPTLDIVIYAEPANKVYLQGTIAAISNSITVAVLATILLHTYAKTKIKTGSLDKEY